MPIFSYITPTQNPLVILYYLQREVQLGRTLRHGIRSPNIHLSPIGVITKKHNQESGNIVLSSPAGTSINPLRTELILILRFLHI